MSEHELIKVELEIPRNIYNIICFIEKRFDKDKVDIIKKLLIHGLEFMSDNLFSEFNQDIAEEIMIMIKNL